MHVLSIVINYNSKLHNAFRCLFYIKSVNTEYQNYLVI